MNPLLGPCPTSQTSRAYVPLAHRPTISAVQRPGTVEYRQRDFATHHQAALGLGRPALGQFAFRRLMILTRPHGERVR